ncbi:MAG TPA: TonB family protein [Rhizomicrobium sp.]|jgi:protein TonB
MVLALAGGRASADPSPPQPVGVHRCAENYPESALEAGIHGATTIAFRIGADGVPTDLQVEKSSGNDDLDNATLKCIAVWRYEPAHADGKPVEVPWKTTVTWDIEIPVPLPKPGTLHDCLSYTPSADEEAHATAPVQIHFIAKTDGSVSEPFVALSSGSKTFDEAAMQCASRWQYLPATRDRQPVAVGWAVRVALQKGVPVVAENFAKPHLCFHYPEKALRDHIEGTTILAFMINTDGRITQASVAKSSGSKELDEATIVCSSRWMYRPAKRDGQPIAVPWGAQVTWTEGYAFVLELPTDLRN